MTTNRCPRLLVQPGMTDPRTEAPQCPNEGRWAPVLQLWSAGFYGKPAEAVLGVFVCDDHRLTDPDEWIAPEGWEQIVQGFRSGGYADPDRSRVKVRFALPTEQIVRELHGGRPS